MTPHPTTSDASTTAGARWVDRYLVPRVGERMRDRTLRGLRILILDPDDDEEAARCDALGASVTTSLGSRAGLDQPDGAFDLIVTGHANRIAARWGSGDRFSAECARVCAPGGALLASLPTRCPVDLSRDRPQIVTLAHLERAFDEVTLLPIQGHFGWRSGGPGRRIAGSVLDAWWRWVASPRHPRVYASALNPVMLIWASRSDPR